MNGSRNQRVTATVSIAFDVEVDGRHAQLSPESIEVNLTSLFRQRAEPLSRHMMPMKVEQAAGEVARSMLRRLGVAPEQEAEAGPAQGGTG